MESNIKANDTLLQNGRHLGLITAAEYHHDTKQLELNVLFEQVNTCLSYTLRKNSCPVGRHEFDSVIGSLPKGFLKEVCRGQSSTSNDGTTCFPYVGGVPQWFIVELLLVKTSKGPKGMNMISRASLQQ